VWLHNAENWDDQWHRRHRIADWLVLTGTLKGLSRSDVTAKLGEPNATTLNGWSLVYYLGAQRGLFPIDDEWLAIRLDANGNVTEATVVVID
jgi:hypothetical protein